MTQVSCQKVTLPIYVVTITNALVFWHDDTILQNVIAQRGVSCHSYIRHCTFGYMQIRVIAYLHIYL